MKKKYIIDRRDVCGGLLLEYFSDLKFEISGENGFKLSEDDLKEQGVSNIKCTGGFVCRGLLFSINEEGLSNDLIYNSPEYPIRGIEPKISLESNYIIEHYVELEELLKFLKFDNNLTQSDLNKIFKLLILNERWLSKNRHVFGIKDADNLFHICNEPSQTIVSREIYDNLSRINSTRNGKPSKSEPDYKLIKKKRISLF